VVKQTTEVGGNQTPKACFLVHMSGTCQSHFRPVQSLCKALRNYTDLSRSTPPFLTLRFPKKGLTPTLRLLRGLPIFPLLGHILSKTFISTAKMSGLVAYLFEFGYDLAINPDMKVSCSPGSRVQVFPVYVWWIRSLGARIC
jgi:hypothetical protein